MVIGFIFEIDFAGHFCTHNKSFISTENNIKTQFFIENYSLKEKYTAKKGILHKFTFNFTWSGCLHSCFFFSFCTIIIPIWHILTQYHLKTDIQQIFDFFMWGVLVWCSIAQCFRVIKKTQMNLSLTQFPQNKEKKQKHKQNVCVCSHFNKIKKGFKNYEHKWKLLYSNIMKAIWKFIILYVCCRKIYCMCRIYVLRRHH